MGATPLCGAPTLDGPKSPPMAHIWHPEDALAGRCTVDDVGYARPLAPLEILEAEGIPADLREDARLARRYAARAIQALARLAEGDSRAAVDAAREILARAYGPPITATTATPAEGAPGLPEWLTRYEHLTHTGRQDD